MRMDKTIRWIGLVAPILLSSYSLAQDSRTTVQAEAVWECDQDASFSLSSESGELNDTIKVYMSADTDGRNAEQVQITLTWSGVSGYLTYIGVDTSGYTIHTDSAEFEPTVSSDTLVMLIDEMARAQSFAGDTLFAVLFRLECGSDGTWRNVPIAGDCEDPGTWFDDADSAQLVGVEHNDGKARIKPLTAEMFFEATVSALPRDTGELVVDYTTNFDVVNGYVFNCTYDTLELTYAGFNKTGYAAANHNLTDTVIGNKVTIRSGSSDMLPLDTNVALFGVLFENYQSDDSTLSLVSHDKPSDTMYMCDDAYATNSTQIGGASIFTPVFAATYDIKDMSVTEGNSATMDIQFINTHQVDMAESDEEKTAAFTLDADEFDKITVAQSSSEVDVVDNGNSYYWVQITGIGSDRRAYREDINAESNDMHVHTTRTKVAGVNFTAQQVAANYDDWLFYKYTTDSTNSLHEKDCQLKSRFIDVVIRPDTLLGDNHITLDSGKIRVLNYVGGGGGSCPFVYTWTGSEYVLEDVILTASEKRPEGSPVTDYLPLTYEPALINGMYRIRIHEQEAEKTFLDHAELLMFDHEYGYDVSVDQSGEFVFGKDRLTPSRIEDDLGQDVEAWMREADNDPYRRTGPGWLMATFVTQRDVQYAIASADEPKPDCKLWAGPVGADVVDPFVVRMEVEDQFGIWHELPKGPMRLPVGHARPIVNLSEYDLGSTFRVRYSWDDHFELDELSLVVQSEVLHSESRSSVAKITHSGDDLSSNAIFRSDEHYTELVTGEFVDLMFPAEPVPDGRKRSIILAAKGYYLTWYGEAEASRPLHFGLNGNYPNPFNPSTTIRYSLAERRPVTIEIFNVLGQRVRTLIDGETQVAGAYEVTWDGQDEQGREVSSGAYLARFRAGEFVETRKLLMLK